MSAETEDQQHPKNDLNKLWEDAVKEFNAMQLAQREADSRKLRQRNRYLACLKRLDCFSSTEKTHNDSSGRMPKEIQTIPKSEQLTPEQLREDLASSVTRKDESDDAKDVPNLAREILGSILELGGFAVKVAASFWEPAELCYTAFHWLVDTVKRYHDYFSGIKMLLDEIKKPLGRFVLAARKIPAFAEKADLELQHILHRLLSTFVWICSHATSLLMTKSGQKLQIAFKVTFIQDDGGIQKNLDVIRELANEEKTLLRWLNYTTVKSLEGANTSEKNKKRIQQALCIQKDQQLWWDTYLQIQQDLVKHTGSWLLNRGEMGKWCDESAGGQPILALEESQASGKTYLCSRIINRLQEKFPSSASSHHGRTYSAFFYSVNMTKSDDSQLFKAITAIILQLTELDEFFQQHVIRRIGSSGTVTIPYPLTKTFWWEMLAEYKPKTQTRYFLVLDGFDKSRDNADLWKRIVKDVCAPNDQEERPLSIRLLLTGSKYFLDEILEGRSASVPRLLIDGANDDDVRLYLEHGVREAYGRGNTNCDGVLGEIQRLLSQLPRDYVKLKELKKAIKQQNHEEGIKQLLQDATKAERRKHDTKSLLADLNKSLPGNRIRDINEMLPWIVLPDRWPTTEEIETVLVLRTGETSIHSLENIINNEYPAGLLTVDGYILSSTRLLDHFSEKIGDVADEKSIREEEATIETKKDGLHESEVAIIHALVKSVCPDDLWQRLRLEEFLESKLLSPLVTGVRITYSPVDAHAKIIVSCLESFRYTWGKPLHAYGIEHLAHHLESITDIQLSQISSETRTRIGEYIYGLLMDKGQDWRTTWCLAQAHFNNGDKTAGDEQVQSLVDNLCDESLPTEANAQEWMPIVKSFAGRGEPANLDIAIKATEILRQNSPGDLELLKMLIDLVVQGDHMQAAEDLITLFKKIVRTTEQCDCSETFILRELFLKYASDSGFHSNVAKVAQRPDGFDILNATYVGAMESLVTATSEDMRSRLGSIRYFYANFLSNYGEGKDHVRQALKLWKMNVSDTSVEVYTRMKSGSKFVTGQLQICEELRKSQQPTWEDQVAKLENSMQDADWQGLLPRHEAYKIARFYSNANQEQKVMDYLRPHIRTAMLYLTDDDPENDWQGYKRLAEVLTYVDEPNALAAWSLIRPEERGDEMDETLSRTGPLAYGCDGGCGHWWAYPGGMNYCQQCTDVQLDSACLEKLTKGELRGVCGAKHTFLTIPSWNPTTAPQNGHVKVGNEEMSVQDWLKKI